MECYRTIFLSGTEGGEVLYMYPYTMLTHVTIHSQHSNWNHYGTHLSEMVVQELLITWPKHWVTVFWQWVCTLILYGGPPTIQQYFFTRLPTPFLPLLDTEIKGLAKLAYQWPPTEGIKILAKAGNRMGTARRCNLARLICTHQVGWSSVLAQPDGIQILTRVSESVLSY